jgi:Trm5-related predicted tRNA methylase
MLARDRLHRQFQWQAAHGVWKKGSDGSGNVGTTSQDQRFNKPIEGHVDMCTIDLRVWVKQIYPVAQKGIRDVQEQIRKGVEVMRNFLYPDHYTVLHREPTVYFSFLLGRGSGDLPPVY